MTKPPKRKSTGKSVRGVAERSDLLNLWSCYGCGYLGEETVDCDIEDCCDDVCCQVCGCHDGDGFGMAENDPRYRDTEQLARVGEGRGK